jgi:hypothetical protein
VARRFAGLTMLGRAKRPWPRSSPRDPLPARGNRAR